MYGRGEAAAEMVAAGSAQAIGRKCVLEGEVDEVCSCLQLAEGCDPQLVRAIAKKACPL